MCWTRREVDTAMATATTEGELLPINPAGSSVIDLAHQRTFDLANTYFPEWMISLLVLGCNQRKFDGNSNDR
jgi:hypothetical protein